MMKIDKEFAEDQMQLLLKTSNCIGELDTFLTDLRGSGENEKAGVLVEIVGELLKNNTLAMNLLGKEYPEIHPFYKKRL